MKIVTVSSLYPNNEDPKHGIFVENRLRNLLADHNDVEASVIAPVPWFPFKSKRFAEYAKFVDVEKNEIRHNINIQHPRYIVIPKIGMLLTPFFMAISLFFALRKNIKQFGRPDLIDGHYFFPDGVAIALVCKYLKLPFTCTSRGTDINLIADMPRPKKMIQWVISRASRCMAVCQALTDSLQKLGATNAVTLRNGVALDFFTPLDNLKRDELRRKYLKGTLTEAASNEIQTEHNNIHKVILSVGWLIERKGHQLVIEALQSVPNTHLYIAGDGPDHKKLTDLVDALNLKQRVSFLGALSQDDLKQYYQIADALVLASSREGWANVLLESMACGTPVVATNIWGTPEVVQTEQAGLLCERDPGDIAKTINKLFANYPERAATRVYAEQFDWKSTSHGQYNIFQTICAQEKKSL